MKWLLNLLGFSSKEEKLRKKMKNLLQKSFDAQRNGDMELAGKYQKDANAIMDQLSQEEV